MEHNRVKAGVIFVADTIYNFCGKMAQHLVVPCHTRKAKQHVANGLLLYRRRRQPLASEAPIRISLDQRCRNVAVAGREGAADRKLIFRSIIRLKLANGDIVVRLRHRQIPLRHILA